MHGDTFSLPSNAKLLAYNEKYFQAFRVGKAIGIQFHIEVDSQMVKEWVNTYNLSPSLINEVKYIENKLQDYSLKLIEYVMHI